MLFCEYFSTRTVGCMPSARFPNRICQYFFSRHPSGWSRDAFGTLLVCLSIKNVFLFLGTSSQIGLISLIIRCVVVWRTFWLRHTEAVSPIRMYRRHCKWKMWRIRTFFPVKYWTFPTLSCWLYTQRKRLASWHYFILYCWQRLSAAGRDFTLCKSVRPRGVLADYKAYRFEEDLRQAFFTAKSPFALRTYIK